MNKTEDALTEILNRAWSDYHPPQQWGIQEHISMALNTFAKHGLELVNKT